ncbi:hypothetical protein VTK73DRAFT_320 [Phialemonium thermophilum]|uniref:N-acetyltransferase domain-containing protein n=1 Tax=Phialemonium thermophilum TaxID=223376 RepID=A0ABR3VVT8_9PEZI
MSKPGMLTTVAVDDALGGEVVGFAQWLRPVPPEAAGAEPQTEAEKEAAREAELSRFPPTMDREAYQEFHAMVDKEAKRIFGERGYKDLWYVAFLAVDPAHQRRGIGRLLLDWGLQRSAAEGRDVYLISTPAGKSLYLAAGFEDLGGFEFGGALQTSMVFRHRQAPSSS